MHLIRLSDVGNDADGPPDVPTTRDANLRLPYDLWAVNRWMWFPLGIDMLPPDPKS